jgi:DNA polymerase III subunit epsilon
MKLRMREIVLDTETTGFKPEEGHRLVEIGAIEIFNKMPTGKTFHHYFNPERDMPKDAEAVHGLSGAFLKDKPLFKVHAEAFLSFIEDSPLIIHNASFDMAFINAELARAGRPAIPWSQVIDTLAMARAKHPMGPNSLDALCKRYGIDNSTRIKHGALLDSELLAEVYLELVGGRQASFGLAATKPAGKSFGANKSNTMSRPVALPSRLSAEDIEAHQALVRTLGPGSLWLARSS